MHLKPPAKGRGEFVLGACIAMSLMADMLIKAGLIDQDELTARLTEAIMLTRGDRQMPLRSMLWLVEQLPRIGHDSGDTAPDQAE